ncbi:hypothetical protein DPEC_G00195130 [Dallia pectoralis]|uniref:Uncharacterized protein n=1 Tax=Dallia pectoralis TaxID=75939 RepID=A0ACC2G7B9_DALPE|nr:hypothetical protein DPEC_G00195130 [Dallia pectoralis]
MLLLVCFEDTVESTETRAVLPSSLDNSFYNCRSSNKSWLCLLVVVGVPILLTFLIFGLVMLLLNKRREKRRKSKQRGANFVECTRDTPSFDLGSAFSLPRQLHHISRNTEEAAGIARRISSTSFDDLSDSFAFDPWPNPDVRAHGDEEDYSHVFPEASLMGIASTVQGKSCNSGRNSRRRIVDEYVNVKEMLREEKAVEDTVYDRVKTDEASVRMCCPADDRRTGERDSVYDRQDREDMKNGNESEDDDDDDGLVDYTTVVFRNQNEI